MLASAQQRRDENEELAAAYSVYVADLVDAWREDPEFGNALHVAVVVGNIKPLKKYLCFARRNAAKAPPAEQAERNAAWLVAAAQKAWRKQHGKARVPGDVIALMVREACDVAARAFGVPVDRIKEADVRSALKTGRFVVP